MTISLEKAIKTSIEFEKKVKDLYGEAIQQAHSLQAKRFYKMLADDEESHLQYLYACLKEWSQNGTIQLSSLVSAIPSQDAIRKSIRESKNQLTVDKQKVVESEMDILRKIPKAEMETARFYKEIIGQLREKDLPLFQQFLRIEEGHERYVDSQIKSLRENGMWLLPVDD